MTRVCLVGSADCDLHSVLRSRETARDALATYRLDQPYTNTVAVETISLGAAISLLNDLHWYLVRYTDASLVLEPSISETEWLSSELASAVRAGEIDPSDTGHYLMVYGIERTDDDARLVDPMFATRTAGAIPEYDLRDVSETLVVRVTESES